VIFGIGIFMMEEWGRQVFYISGFIRKGIQFSEYFLKSFKNSKKSLVLIIDISIFEG